MPLHIASRKGYVEVVELLIRYGAVPDFPNKVSWINHKCITYTFVTYVINNLNL